jgi:hypothetical protein
MQVRLFETDPRVQYSFTNFSHILNGTWAEVTKFDTSPRGYWDLPKRRVTDGLFTVEAAMCERLLVHQPIFPSTVMMTRTFFEAVGRCNESLGHVRSMDMEFAFRCARQAPIGVVADPVVGIRKHASNFSGDILRTTLGEVEILEFIRDHFPGPWHDTVCRQITARTIGAAERAFTEGDFDLTRTLLRHIRHKDRGLRLEVKSVLANVPPRIRNFLLGRILGRANVGGNGIE